MMGRQDDRQQTLFYDFSLEEHVPEGHLLRKVAGVLDLSDVRRQLAPVEVTGGAAQRLYFSAFRACPAWVSGSTRAQTALGPDPRTAGSHHAKYLKKL
jgi:hypothetical protein